MRRPSRWWIVFAASLLGLAPCVAQAASAAGAPSDSSFWARYMRLLDVLDTDSTAARRTVNATLARDPDDALATWARVARVTPQDSASLAAVAPPPTAGAGPGAHFAWACVRVRGGSDAGWSAFALARAGWIGAGRAAEAARAEVLMLQRDSDLKRFAFRQGRFADAESLATAAGEPGDALAARMRRVFEQADHADPQAVPEMEAAVRTLEPQAGSVLLADVLGSLAFVLKNQGRLDESAQRYLQQRRAAEAAGVESLVLRARFGLAGVWKARGDVRAGLDEERATLARARAVGNRLLEGLLLNSIGQSEMSLHHLDAARDALEQSLDLLTGRGGSFDSRITALDQLGGVEAMAGHPDLAAKHFDEALAMARVRGARHREAFVLLHLAEFATDQGRFEDARRWNDLALAAARQSGRRRAEEMALAQGAGILDALDLPADAADMALAGVRLTRETEPRNYGNVVGYAVGSLLRAHRAAEARALVDSLRAFLAAHPDSLSDAGADRFDARLALAAGDAPAAVAAASHAVATLRALDARGLLAAAHVDLGAAWLAAGRADSAARAIERALPWYEGVLLASESSDDRISTQSRWQDAFVELAVARVRLGDVAGAFEVMDHSRARELRHAFGDHSPVAPVGAPAARVRELSVLEDDLRGWQGRVFEQYARPPAKRDPALTAWERHADSLRTRWRDLHRAAQREAGDGVDPTGEPLPAARTLASLRDGERLLAFFVGESHALVFDATRAGVVARELPWARVALERETRAWRTELARGSGERWREGARRIADSLFAGLAFGGGERRFYVIPDGPLDAIPFEALLVPGAGGGRVPLLERGEVVYGDSPSALFTGGVGRAESLPRAVALAAFGDPARGAAADSAHAGAARTRERLALAPLPSARREVAGLAALFPASRVYLGLAASEAAFRTEFARAGVLHVAAHGFVDDQHPEFSGIVLSPRGHGDDGVLQAWELLDRRAHAELVTLSACESGLGRATGGEGLLGLSRAFTLAGARQCVVSLWRVDDEAAADLMLDFYARLAHGATPAAALRAARLAMSHAAGSDAAPARGVSVRTGAQVRAHPAAWAAFVLRASRLR